MKRADWASWIVLGAATALALACGSLQGPSDPSQEPEHSSASGPGDSGLALGGPATPSASPSASPAPDGQPSPRPDGGGEGAAGCGTPLPPPISKIAVKVHIQGPEVWTLDATPLVGPDAEYCRNVGFTDGRSNCAVRQEGDPQRIPCETYAVGVATDTNRAGPTWTLDGHYCDGRASGCENHDQNQYLLKTFRSGTFRACARNGACGEVAVAR